MTDQVNSQKGKRIIMPRRGPSDPRHDVRNPSLLKAKKRRADTIDPRSYRNNRVTEAIYVIRYPDFVKIGWSSDFPKRCSGWMAEAARLGVPVTLVAVAAANRSAEGAVHNYFRQYNMRVKNPGYQFNEDFAHAPEVTEWVRWLRDQPCVAAGDDTRLEQTEINGSKKLLNVPLYPNGIPDSVELADFRGLQPNKKRRKEPQFDLFNRDATVYAQRVLTADDYYTPPDIMDRVRAVMGSITLDPATHAQANGIIRADTIYTKTDNGLAHPWCGKVWLNPPFEQWNEFAAKTCEELDRGQIDVLMALISTPALNTKYMRPLLKRAKYMVIPEGRITCWGPMASSSPTGHMLLLFTQHAEYLDAARRAFPPDEFLIVMLAPETTL